MSTFDRVVDAGRSFACGLYRSQPGALIPNPPSDVLRLVWDDLCGDDPSQLPPPPSPPFSGGQCGGISYWMYFVLSTSNPPFEQRAGFFTGEIASVSIRQGPSGLYQGFVLCQGAGGTFHQDFREYVFYAGQVTPFTLSSYRFERGDNLPDNCGNPPAAYPSVPPPSPGGYTSPPISITYNDGDDFTAIFNLKPPVGGDAPPPPDICLSVIVSGVELKLCFPFGLPPSFGDDGGGINDILTDIQNTINNLQDDVNNLQDDVDNLQDDFDKFTDPPPPESDPDLNETDSPDDEGGEQDDLPGLKWVLVRLTTLPVKSQFGTPSVNFAGWITFKIGGDYTDRIPIAFENGVFQAPPGATGYAITFTNMAKGISKAYTQDITP